MSWNTTDEEDSRRRFVDAVLARRGSFVALCRAHGISPRCGYKWWHRFQRDGRRGLQERSRYPDRYRRLHARWWPQLAAWRRQHPTWGPLKLRIQLCRRGAHPPSTRTLGRWLASAGLVRRRPRRARPGPLVPALAPKPARCANDVWTIDFKGRFRTGDGARCDPLTVRDQASRFVLVVRAVRQPSEQIVRHVLTGLFRRYGLPRTIRVDNGTPFGGCGALGLSRLSVWWLRLGLRVEFSRPACPQDNGAHEQMHRVLKAETARPPAANARAQQRRFAHWCRIYNYHRPHAALDQQTPASRYRPSPRPWPGRLPTWCYPARWTVLRPGANGRAWWADRQRVFGRAFVGERLGLRPRAHGMVEVYLGPHLIGTLHPNDLAGLRPARRQYR